MKTKLPAPEMQFALWRRLVAEMLGTGLLVAVVVGSGIAASRLSPADTGLQILENSFATALGLSVLIVVLGPVSGAHFNPIVSLVDAVLDRRRRAGLPLGELPAYLIAQLLGGLAGAALANTMFDTGTTLATTERASGGQLIGEVVATAGLVLVIFSLARAGHGPLVVGPAVGAYIGSAYWFTSSTSFANPAVTIGRMISDTLTGIAPSSVPPFLVAQLLGGAVGALLVFALFRTPISDPQPRRQ